MVVTMTTVGVKALSNAAEFLGKKVNDLNMKDYIAAQHLLNIIDQLEISIINLSIKADENLKIISSSENEKTKNITLNNLKQEVYVYNMYKDRLSSSAYRNLISDSLKEEVILKMDFSILLDLYDNTDNEEFQDFNQSQRENYEDTLSELAQIHKNRDSFRLQTISELYDAISTIASVGLIDKFLIMLPFSYLYLLRNKK